MLISNPRPLWLSLFTWAIVLLVSDLPNAIWQAMLGEPPAWLFWVKIGFLGVLILISLVWKPIQDVRPYFFLLLVLMLALWGMNWLRGTSAYSQWENKVNWVIAMAGFQLLKAGSCTYYDRGFAVDGKAMEGFLPYTGSA